MSEGRATRVVIASRLFAPEVGAAAFRLKALADGLAAEGAQVHVITTKAPSGETLTHAPYRISRWPVLRDAGGNVRGYVQYLSYDVPAFFRVLLSGADIVVSEPPPTTGLVIAVSSLLRRRPFFYYAADVWSEALEAMKVPGMVIKVMRAVEGFVLRRASGVLAVSDAIAAQVAKFGVPEDRITVVGNGVATDNFSLDGPSGASESDPYFVYTGTMSEWQGAEIFIRALPEVLAEYPSLKIRFFGQGTDEDHLQNLAEELAPGAVEFGGVVPPKQAATWIRGAAAALVSIKPGQGYDFAKPTKIYAAAACGTEVIFAGQGEGAELVASNGLGRRTEYAPAAVAEAMKQALSNPSSIEQRVSRAHWVAENASLEASGRVAARRVLSTHDR